MQVEVNVNVDGIEYAATCGENQFGDVRVIISAGGVYAGRGGWDAVNKRIEDCDADVPDEAYEALDAALLAAMVAE